MPKLIHWYILRRLSKMLLLATLGLALFAIVSSGIGELNLKGADLFLLNAFKIVPFIVYDMLPLGCVMGVVLGVQSLINNNELPVMKGLGLTNGGLAWLVALPAFVFGVAAWAWIDLAAVPLYKYAKAQLNPGQPNQVAHLWLSPRLSAESSGGQAGSRRLIIYIDRLQGGGEFAGRAAGGSESAGRNGDTGYAENLVMFEFVDNQLAGYTKASQVQINSGAAASQAQADSALNWDRQRPDNLATRRGWDYALGMDIAKLSSYAEPRRAQNSYQLWQSERANRQVGLPNAIKLYEIWDRLSKPLLFVSLALLMLAFCLATPPRTSIVLKVIIAIALGLLLGTFFRSIAFYAAAADASYLWLGSLGPPLLLSALSYWRIMSYN